MDQDGEAEGVGAQSAEAAACDASLPASDYPAALPAGYHLQEYVIEAVLGRGSFGITYLAQDTNLQCAVAIKEYLPDDLAWRGERYTVQAKPATELLGGYEQGRARFLAECRTLASFKHPNIVRVARFFEANNTGYMVMDYERGQPLRDWMERHGPVDQPTLLAMFVPLLDGLAAVHAKGVLHRDIKPANIYVRDQDHSLVLLDFGAAREMFATATRSVASVLTPGYAPLEQYHNQGGQGPWTDLYALAGVLFWAVTGQRPVEAPGRVRIDGLARAADLARRPYSEHLLHAIDWGLAPDADARPQDVAAFKDALLGEKTVPTALLAGRSAHDSRFASSKQVRYAVGAFLVIALATGFGSYFATGSGETQTPAIPHETAQAPHTAPANMPAPPSRAKKSTAARTSEERHAASGEATIVLDIDPQGEVWLDGVRAGHAPPLQRLPVSAGKHVIKIEGNEAPWYYYYTVTLEPKETRRISAKFTSQHNLN